ncbi:hypothetical protein BDY17DRAFT_325065 [Neohortaea acidophila]|uniref:Calcofluor white hypersensitive protein n=1 Tax=Neohortaea acidophila TaxID=245834 RepID=A0A6A6PT05_9PEZI|nr:uncharacterized protein BDY17DRAFT_325065 [Neohortaea acidophila]KAF2482811.1 hypothetical protein BDY17DRAFT_325065 [Neohortaea acidophila]
MSARAWQVGGLAVAGGVGYYLYQAGGDPKTAQKKAEADANKLSHKVKDELPGRGKEAKKDAEAAASDISAKARNAANDAKAEADKVASKAGTNLNAAVDQFDKSVTEGASKAKSGISSWLGGK